jgi:polar amino acid transport system ATP-binding protein
MKDIARIGLTMIVVTHEMNFARDAASRIVFLDKGKIVEVAAAAAFFEHPATERSRQFLERYR